MTTVDLSEPAPVAGDLPRTVLGLAILAAERLGAGGPVSATVQTSVGLAGMGADRVRAALDRLTSRPSDALGWGARLTESEPGPGPARRLGGWLTTATGTARSRGAQSVDIARNQALHMVQANTDAVLTWVQQQVAPRVIDGLMPHLEVEVVPRLIAGAMPQIKNQVLPEIVADLTTDPKLRDLILEESRGALGQAARQIQQGVASADDRVESAARGMFGHGRTGPPEPGHDDARDAPGQS